MIGSNYRGRIGRRIGYGLRSCWKRFRNDSQGQGLVEYALVAGLMAVAAFAAIPALSSLASAAYSKAVSVLAGYVG